MAATPSNRYNGVVSGARHTWLCAALAAATLACLLLAPSTATAAMVCTDAAEQVSEPADEAPWTLLEVELPNDDTIELRRDQAPMSLTEGASAVAPRSVQRTSDARIEASRRCEDQVGAQELVSPEERQHVEPPSSVMEASLPRLPLLRAAAPLAMLARLPVEDATAVGVRHDVDRPPRR